MNYDKIFRAAIDRLHDEGCYRVFIDILRTKGSFPNAHCFHGWLVTPTGLEPVFSP